LWDCFAYDDFASGFDLFFEICKHITHGHVPPLVSCLLVALQLLVLEKQIRGVRPITIGKVIYQLVAHTLTIRFKDTFAKHFSPHQFGVATLSMCEIVVHGLKVMLDLHLKWVVL
jgi:hypothetical protein